MTRDEYRKACIEAMEEAFYVRSSGEPASVYDCMVAAFDALHGVARVNQIEATEEMINTLDDSWFDVPICDIGEVFEILSATGDLTNPPEKKP